jgi:hypothetical protein
VLHGSPGRGVASRRKRHPVPQCLAPPIARVINEVSDAVVGLGPIEFLLKDPDITEVIVNGPDDLYVERKGRIERVGRRHGERRWAYASRLPDLSMTEASRAPARPASLVRWMAY